MQLKIERVPISEWHCRDANQLYKKIAKIGQGTYGKVYKASKLDVSGELQYVALKQIDTSREKSGFPITALREIKILQKINHENIVKLHEIVTSEQKGNNKGNTFLVFDYITYDLSWLLTKKIQFTLPQIKTIMKQILSGVEYLHQCHIMHRDIKSANILYSETGDIKVGDFGLAKQMTKGYLTNRVVTLWYRAPELLLGSMKYDYKVDVWSVGLFFSQCLLAELLLLKPIFSGENTEIKQLQIIFERCGFFESEWREARELPLFSEFGPKKQYQRTFSEYFKEICPTVDDCTLNFLNQLLALNPAKRLSAGEALKHTFFVLEPLPILSNNLPQFDFADQKYEPEYKQIQNQNNNLQQNLNKLKQSQEKLSLQKQYQLQIQQQREKQVQALQKKQKNLEFNKETEDKTDQKIEKKIKKNL